MVDEMRTRFIAEKMKAKSALKVICNEIAKHNDMGDGAIGRIDWAIEEILKAIEHRYPSPPIVAIDEFRDKMLKFMEYNEKAYNSFYIPFVIAERYSDLYYAGII